MALVSSRVIKTELWRLLAHNHWFIVSILDYKIRLCARCSGYVSGLLLYNVLSYLGLGTYPFDSLTSVLVCLCFSMPLIWDWVTQSWGRRESNNPTRFITGISLGFGLGFSAILSAGPASMEMIYASTLLVILAFGLHGKNTRFSTN